VVGVAFDMVLYLVTAVSCNPFWCSSVVSVFVWSDGEPASWDTETAYFSLVILLVIMVVSFFASPHKRCTVVCYC